MSEQEIRASALLAAATVTSNYPATTHALFLLADEYAKYIKGEKK